MIRIYFVRHGIAVDREDRGSLPDTARPLTKDGRERFRRAAKAFARLGEPLDALFTSPLVRAVQTAEILAGALGRSEVDVLTQLEPEVPPEALFGAVAKLVKDGEAVGLVGHDPQLSRAVALAAGLSAEEAVALDFRKGSILRIDVKGLPKPLPSVPRWWMRPRRRELVKGLPLRGFAQTAEAGEEKPDAKADGKQTGKS